MTRALPGSDDLTALCDLVRDAAREHILSRAADPQARRKADGSWVTDADLAMQDGLRATLTRRWPQVPLLGEEMTADEQKALMRAEAAAPDGPGLWVLDPLDGTSNFAAGVPAFGPSLAWIQGGVVRLGVVHDVMRDETFAAALGAGAWLDGAPLHCPRPSRPLRSAIACVDFKRLPAELATRLATRPPYASQRALGSVALEWCWVAAGRFQVYLHGAQGLWDYAAGSLILAEAGGCATTLEGTPVFDNTLAKRSALCATGPDLLEAWAGWITARPVA